MFNNTVKYLAIIFCGFYGLQKILMLQCSLKIKLVGVGLSALLALAGCQIRAAASSLGILFMVLGFVCCAYFLFRQPLNLTIIAGSIAFGLSYTLSLFSAMLVAATLTLAAGRFPALSHIATLQFLLTGALQFALLVLLFRIKRFQCGIPYLREHGSDDVGAYISLTIVLAMSFTGMWQSAEYIFFVPVVFLVLAGILLLFWWRSTLQRKYKEKAKCLELNQMETLLHRQETEIAQLKAQNAQLASVVHRDNKLIPAMSHAVTQALKNTGDAAPAARQAIADKLLKELETLQQGREGMLQAFTTQGSLLPVCGVFAVDHLVRYFGQRAAALEIDFSASFSGSIKHLLAHCIEAQNLLTLLADLLENALHAVSAAQSKRVFLHIGLVQSIYCVDVFDSGAMFSRAVLCSLGQRRITTRQAEGGSGIGLESLFLICRQTQASVVIDEALGHSVFTKKVSVCFDGKDEYRIRTHLAAQLRAMCPCAQFKILEL